ncbi:MAG: nuclear transport factor 2 family protein [Stenomitos rutilans HA7619-LM2]|jgi:ketosteroid isomerase-like protein|nr:nuclear transport factor 2 family protein [Stenomitos rutilans HA7619-LM2]
MKTENLKINQLSPQAYEWYLGYLEAIDNKNIQQYGAYLADDCVMYQNNNEPIAGKAIILEGLFHYWQTFKGLTHDLLNLYGTDSSFVLEALNHYQRHDGEAVTVRAVAITERDESGLVISFRFYTDTTPVFA